MTDEKTTEARELHPVSVTVLGTSHVTGGPSPMTTGTTAVTPEEHQPNLLVQVVSPLAAILIRFVNTYLTVLVGLVGAGLTSEVIPSSDFMDLVLRCAGLSIAGAGFGLLKDVVTVFSGLERKYPLQTGAV